MTLGTDIDLEWTLGPDIDTDRYTRAQTLKLTVDLARPLTGADMAALADIVRRIGAWADTVSGTITAYPGPDDLEPLPRLRHPLPWPNLEEAFGHGFAQGVLSACDELDRQVGGAGDPRVDVIRRKASPMARDWLLAAKARGEA